MIVRSNSDRMVDILLTACLIASLSGLAASACACSPQPSGEPAVNPHYVEGLGYCLEGIRLQKERMRLEDSGIDRALLRSNYNNCARNVNELFGVDAGQGGY